MAVSSRGGAKRHGGSPGLSRILRMVMPGKKGGEKGRGGELSGERKTLSGAFWGGGGERFLRKKGRRE